MAKRRKEKIGSNQVGLGANTSTILVKNKDVKYLTRIYYHTEVSEENGEEKEI
jgi:hypothetical protein